jgi:AraC-like DNA-binding protein
MIPTLESRVNFDDFADIFNYCQKHYGPKFALHLAKENPIGKFSVLDYAIANCATLGEAYQTLAKYWSLVSAVSNYKIHINENEVWLGARYPEYLMKKAPAVAEMTIFHILNLGRAITETDWVPNKILLQNSATDKNEYKKTFKCPVYNDQKECVLVFDKLLMKLPVRNSSKELRRLMEASARKLQSNLSSELDILSDVITAIKHNLNSHTYEIENVAKELGMSVRTLQRKLKEVSYSYNDLLAKIRIADAQILLAENDFSISEISALLGYKDLSSFYRFFKKQMGQTPDEYRNKLKHSV